MKKIPIGIDDFKKIRENNIYYVDKTKYIEKILVDTSEVKLFTRPRRFGKTLNMSMLKYFFDIKNKEENKKLFQNLYIEKSDFFKEQGAYPVVYISLKGIKADTWESSFFLIKSLISSIYNEFEYIREKLNESQLDSFNKIWLKKDDGEYRNALKNLTSFLYEYYKKEVILLIDEYDSPLINAYEHGYYDRRSPRNRKSRCKTFCQRRLQPLIELREKLDSSGRIAKGNAGVRPLSDSENCGRTVETPPWTL